jgi:hypothetical protein
MDKRMDKVKKDRGNRKGRRPWMPVVLPVFILAATLAGCSAGTGGTGGTGGAAASSAANSAAAQTQPKADSATAAAAGGDLVIPLSALSQTVTFYPVEVDGTKLEVLAVVAPDGSVRTAFNTCQVCYDSGKGYYKQDGSALVCQNCGNRFQMDQVEVLSGGCNPVPIFPEDKIVTEESITIPFAFLSEFKTIFSNWKS